MPVGLQTWTLRGFGNVGPYFRVGIPGAPWGARVSWIGTDWAWSETSGLFQFAFNLVMTWDAANFRYSWTGNLRSACFPFGFTAVTFHWYPRMIASAAIVRAQVDEEDRNSGELWRWELPLEKLPALPNYQVTRGSWLWYRDHVRGWVKKLNSSALPRAAGQQIWFRQ